MKNKKIGVIGSGITGLTAANILEKRGFEVTLFEKNSEPGGAIKSVQNGDWLTEYGPNTLLLKEKIVTDFLKGLELEPETLIANSEASKRYIVKNGELVPLPLSFMGAISTPLFSFLGKLRLLLEPFISVNSNRDQTVAEFVERRLGKEMLDYAMNPFVAGIFANNPDQLSLRHVFPQMTFLEEQYGSLILGAVAGSKRRKREGKTGRSLISFKMGIQELPKRLASSLTQIHYNQRITAFERQGQQWILKSDEKSFGPFDHVIINIPLYQSAELLNTLPNYHFKFDIDVDYPPLSVLHLGYKKSDIQHSLDGFGFLVPEVEKRYILGALFSSTLFEGRAPADHHLLTVFVGGGRQPELAGLATHKLLPIVEKELSELIGLNNTCHFMDHVYWPKAIPAYHVGYDSVLDQMDQFEDQYEGLILAGNFRNGVSVPDCIKNGKELAESFIT